MSKKHLEVWYFGESRELCDGTLVVVNESGEMCDPESDDEKRALADEMKRLIAEDIKRKTPARAGAVKGEV